MKHPMHIPTVRLVILLGTALAAIDGKGADLPRVLVFGKVQAGQYVHASIPDGARAIVALGKANGFAADTSDDAGLFTTANLARYRAVVFNNTGGEVLDAGQRSAFQNFIRAGGGYAGFHSACGTEFTWPWYGDLIGGGRFLKHPAIQKATVVVEDARHLSTSMLPARWERVDEWHDYQANPRPNVHVLLTVDEASYQGGTMGKDHPIAWCREFEGGRAWFSGLGHGAESFREPLFLAHLLGGIRYAMGAEVVSLGAPARQEAPWAAATAAYSVDILGRPRAETIREAGSAAVSKKGGMGYIIRTLP